ncbi:MAG: hypothetical protein AW07_04609 [Candidatus Accumulibacter sp. SK-11]|nr:MAG: hypothetical protein AW07_04609 [Candidatus Accumulibacter sp. SK-11]
MVPGDHFHGDTGGLADSDGLLRLGARWVDDAHQRDQRQLVGPAHQVSGRIELRHRDGAAGQGQHTHGGCGIGVVLRGVFATRCVVQALLACRRQPARRACQQNIRRTLHPHADDVPIAMERGHELVRRVEGNFGDARIPCHKSLRVDARLSRQRQQGTFGGVADQFVVLQAGIGAQGCGRQQCRPVRRGLFVLRFNAAVAAVTFTTDDEVAAQAIDAARRHLV